jgi:hypothetical protein
MVVGNENLPNLRQMAPQSMPVTEKDLLELSSIDPDEPGKWPCGLICPPRNGLNYYWRVTFWFDRSKNEI